MHRQKRSVWLIRLSPLAAALPLLLGNCSGDNASVHGDAGTTEDGTGGAIGNNGSGGVNSDSGAKGTGASSGSSGGVSSGGTSSGSGNGSGGTRTDGGSGVSADGGGSGSSHDAGTKCTSGPGAPPMPPGCVQCLSDSDCGASARHCLNGACVQCASAADCSGTSTPACYPATHTCGASCVSDAGACTGFTPYCDMTSGACVGCRSSADCPANARVCDSTAQQCVVCASNADCAGTSMPYCDTTSHTCATCGSNADCTNPAMPICRTITMGGGFGMPPTTTRACQPGCTSNSQCTDGGAPVCSSMGNCVRCAANSDCPSDAPVCDMVFNSGCYVCLPPPPGSDAGSQGCDGGTCMSVGMGGPNLMFRCQ